ncbi:MAG: ACP S-malonyltransferase [Bdellovibrionales bacterium]|nr:ACP S-malonyltransferase [Bdellovibrionales bacterium]
MTFLFPGQGSQSVGMGKVFYPEFAQVRETFEEASDALSFDVKKLCFDGPETDLALTHNTQPALLTVSTAITRAVSAHLGLKADRAAGHSLGEYSALVALGTLGFQDAARAVRTRGEAMQSAVPVGEGAMAAVLGLSDDDVVKMCAWATKSSGLGPLEAANFNCPGQVVVSGKAQTMEWLKANLNPEAAGISAKPKMIPLNVSAPFHSSLMKPAEDRMREVLGKLVFKNPNASVIQNFSAEDVLDPAVIRENLTRQISSTVRWTQSVLKMKALGSTRWIELGSGKVLSGLMKKIDGTQEVLGLNSMDDWKKLESLLNSLEKKGPHV